MGVRLCYDRAQGFVGGVWKCLELRTGKAIEYLRLSGLFRGSFDDDQSIESNTDKKGLTWEVSEGSLRVPQRLYV